MRRLEYIIYLFLKYGFNLKSLRSACRILVKRKGYVKIELKQYKHPIYLRAIGSDLEVFYEIMLRFGYRLKTKLAENPKTIVDCGANIGLASIYLKSLYPEAKLIAIEPENENYHILEKNLQPYTNVECLNVGIWNKHCRLAISNPAGNSYGFTLKEVEMDDPNGIESLSIKNVMDKFAIDTIDFLKIDIEGSEKELFEVDADCWLSQTKVVAVELHDSVKYGCSKSFFNAINKYDFATEVRGENLICYIT